MGKIKIAIADKDEKYVKALERYFAISHPKGFCVFTFSNPEAFGKFLLKEDSDVDLILAGPEYARAVPQTAVMDGISGKIIELAEEMPVNGQEEEEKGNATYRQASSGQALFKYQHAEFLISRIIGFYSKKSSAHAYIPGKKHTALVSFVSASGGCGKSSIAACLSMVGSGRGLKCFYLNLEDVPSTSLFFPETFGPNFSEAIFYIKERESSLPLKLEAVKSVDPDSKVSFFRPPDSIAETEDLDGSDLEVLLDSFISGSAYDAVFIDLPGGLTAKNSVIVDKSDIVVQIALPGQNARNRDRLLTSALEDRYGENMENIPGKLIRVLNRIDPGFGKDEYSEMPNERVSDESFDFIIFEDRSKPYNGFGQEFYAQVGKLLEKILKEVGAVESGKHGGSLAL
jgi:cellulose biosynthesis protein BcsQ